MNLKGKTQEDPAAGPSMAEQTAVVVVVVVEVVVVVAAVSPVA